MSLNGFTVSALPCEASSFPAFLYSSPFHFLFLESPPPSQLALESVPIAAYGATIGTDTLSLSASDTYLDGCFRRVSNLDPVFPPNQARVKCDLNRRAFAPAHDNPFLVEYQT